MIKASALSEDAVTRAIVRHLGKGADDFVGGRSMSQRLKLAEGLSLLSCKSLQDAPGLSKLRNRRAHDVAQVNFTFSEYPAETDQRNEFFGVYVAGIDGTMDIAGQTIAREDFFRENPRSTVNNFLFDLLLDVHGIDARTALRHAGAELTEQLFAATQG